MSSASPVTSAGATAAAGSAAPGRGFRFGGLMLAEWTKIRSVRSTIWTLALFFIISVGLTAAFTALVVSTWGGPRSSQGDLTIRLDPVGFILGSGLQFGQLTICVLGVLLISAEYSTGVIRASLLAVPRRLPMLAAKITVAAAMIFVVGEIVALCSFFLGSAMLHSKVAVALSDPGVTRVVLCTGLYLTVLGIFALAIGGLIRHTAGGIATVIGVVFVLPIIGNFLPGTWGAHIYGYMPTHAGTLLLQSHPQAGDVLSPWQGFGVFCAYTVVLLAVAGYLLRHRDA